METPAVPPLSLRAWWVQGLRDSPGLCCQWPRGPGLPGPALPVCKATIVSSPGAPCVTLREQEVNNGGVRL